MNKKYIVRLTTEERCCLEKLIKTGKAAASKRLHAQILLKADIGGNGSAWKDQRISDAFSTSIGTIEKVRKRLVMQGFDAAVNRAKGSGRKRTFDGEDEAHLIAVACSEPPEGRSRWTLRLLADHMVKLDYVETISHDTVYHLLKKTNSNLS